MAAILVKGYRPSKKADIPPPLYLTSTDIPPSYCHTCGRVISNRRVKASAKFCSDKCKHHKPSASLDSIGRLIEDVLHELLNLHPIATVNHYARSHPAARAHKLAPINDHGSGAPSTEHIKDTRAQPVKKGDKRVIVPCSLVETIVFGRLANVSRSQGKRRERARIIAGRTADGPELDGESAYDEPALRATLSKLDGRTSKTSDGISSDDDDDDEDDDDDDDESCHESDVNSDEQAATVTQTHGQANQAPSHGTLEDLRIEGQRKAQQRETVRNACRRAVVFGLAPPGVQAPALPTPVSAAAGDGVRDGERAQHGGKGGRKGNAAARARRERGEEESGEASGGVPRRRLCEAFMRGEVVEPSFAKGEWGVRWRE